MNRDPSLEKIIGWTRREIDTLIEMHLLEFLPPTPCGLLRPLPWKKQRVLIKKLKEKLPKETLRRLNSQYRILRNHPPTRENLPYRALEAARSALSEDQFTELTADACSYLVACLGFGLTGKPREIPNSLSALEWRRLDLKSRSQLMCVLEWAELYEDVWTSTLWRECLEMRYARGEQPAISYLDDDLRQDLRKEAGRLRRRHRSVLPSDAELTEAAARIAHGRATGARMLICCDYLKATVEGPLRPEHPLNQPITSAGIFCRLPAPTREHESLHPYFKETYAARFERYLSIPESRPDALVGEILSYLAQIDRELWPTVKLASRRIPGIPPSPPTWKDYMEPPNDFVRISERYRVKLGIKSEVFYHLWCTCQTLRRRRELAELPSPQMAVYLVTRILKSIRPDVYRFYLGWVQTFRSNVLRPLVRLGPQKRIDQAIIQASVDPFRQACNRDPLLNCVFHSEVHGGDRRLESPEMARRSDAQLVARVIVCTVKILKDAKHVLPRKLKVQDVLSDDLDLSCHVRNAVLSADHSSRTNGGGHFAFAAPIVAAVIGRTIAADSVTYICFRHATEPDVDDLLQDVLARVSLPAVARFH